MIDWWRLGMSVFSVALIGGLIALMLLAPKVLVVFGEVFIVCIGIFFIIFLVYKDLGD